MLWYYKLKSFLTNKLVVVTYWCSEPRTGKQFKYFYKVTSGWDKESYIVSFDNTGLGMHFCYSLEGPDVYKGFKKIPFHSLMSFLI